MASSRAGPRAVLLFHERVLCMACARNMAGERAHASLTRETYSTKTRSDLPPESLAKDATRHNLARSSRWDTSCRQFSHQYVASVDPEIRNSHLAQRDRTNALWAQTVFARGYAKAAKKGAASGAAKGKKGSAKTVKRGPTRTGPTEQKFSEKQLSSMVKYLLPQEKTKIPPLTPEEIELVETYNREKVGAMATCTWQYYKPIETDIRIRCHQMLRHKAQQAWYVRIIKSKDAALEALPTPLRKFAEIPDLALFPLARPVATYHPNLPADHPFLQAVRDEDELQGDGKGATPQASAAPATTVHSDEDDYDDEGDYEDEAEDDDSR
eukprot:scaffold1379_cov390-Prasinococcus_capsulatus_cf.AAC.9